MFRVVWVLALGSVSVCVRVSSVSVSVSKTHTHTHIHPHTRTNTHIYTSHPHPQLGGLHNGNAHEYLTALPDRVPCVGGSWIVKGHGGDMKRITEVRGAG